jgi:excisionase family DNA binding protein
VTSATTDDNVVAAAGIEPVLVRMVDAQRLFGLSRTGLYRLASKGQVAFYKSGRRTLIDFASLKAAVAKLPRAVISIAS